MSSSPGAARFYEIKHRAWGKVKAQKKKIPAATCAMAHVSLTRRTEHLIPPVGDLAQALTLVFGLLFVMQKGWVGDRSRPCWPFECVTLFVYSWVNCRPQPACMGTT